MALHLIATPIGNPNDISLRALEILKKVDYVIGEELKITKQILSQYKTGQKELYRLNEHSKADDIQDLVALCKDKEVALVTDCGTPGFCDPGSKLVKELRKNNIPIHSVPGASSLMYLLSLSSERIDSFYFAGFLPAKKELRGKAWKYIKSIPSPSFLLETPYRFQKLLEEMKSQIPQRKILIGINLSSENELLWEGKVQTLQLKDFPDKAEPMILIYQ